MRMKDSKVFSIKWPLSSLCALYNLYGGTEEYYKSFDQEKIPSGLVSNPLSSEEKKIFIRTPCRYHISCHQVMDVGDVSRYGR
jgi:hypothetical protein